MPMKLQTGKLTAARLRKVLDYDPRTGEFIRLINSPRPQGGGRGCKGQRAGSTASKRPSICIDGHHYRAHRLAFLWMTGRWPRNQLDHKNLNSSDNRWLNLREATPSQNSANCNTKNSFGYKGVFYEPRGRRKYVARISIKSQTKYLGAFTTPHAAHAAYVAAARESFGEFARRR